MTCSKSAPSRHRFSAPLRLGAFALKRIAAACLIALILGMTSMGPALAEPPTPTLLSPFVAVDLHIGESQNLTVPSGQPVTVKLVGLEDFRDTLRGAVRRSEVKV